MDFFFCLPLTLHRHFFLLTRVHCLAIYSPISMLLLLLQFERIIYTVSKVSICKNHSMIYFRTTTAITITLVCATQIEELKQNIKKIHFISLPICCVTYHKKKEFQKISCTHWESIVFLLFYFVFLPSFGNSQQKISPAQYDDIWTRSLFFRFSTIFSFVSICLYRPFLLFSFFTWVFFVNMLPFNRRRKKKSQNEEKHKTYRIPLQTDCLFIPAI